MTPLRRACCVAEEEGSAESEWYPLLAHSARITLASRPPCPPIPLSLSVAVVVIVRRSNPLPRLYPPTSSPPVEAASLVLAASPPPRSAPASRAALLLPLPDRRPGSKGEPSFSVSSP